MLNRQNDLNPYTSEPFTNEFLIKFNNEFNKTRSVTIQNIEKLDYDPALFGEDEYGNIIDDFVVQEEKNELVHNEEKQFEQEFKSLSIDEKCLQCFNILEQKISTGTLVKKDDGTYVGEVLDFCSDECMIKYNNLLGDDTFISKDEIKEFNLKRKDKQINKFTKEIEKYEKLIYDLQIEINKQDEIKDEYYNLLKDIPSLEFKEKNIIKDLDKLKPIEESLIDKIHEQNEKLEDYNLRNNKKNLSEGTFRNEIQNLVKDYTYTQLTTDLNLLVQKLKPINDRIEKYKIDLQENRNKIMNMKERLNYDKKIIENLDNKKYLVSKYTEKLRELMMKRKENEDVILENR